MTDRSAAQLCKDAQAAWAQGQSETALDLAWRAYRQDPHYLDVTWLLASLLWRSPALAGSERRDDLAALAVDPNVEPESVSAAGWVAVLAGMTGGDDRAVAEALEGDALAVALLEAAPVNWPDAERRLVRVRRWLLISRAWADFPKLSAALAVQAWLNSGAWDFDDEERARLVSADAGRFVLAYLPLRLGAARADVAAGTAAAVARHYERWPYPRWRRIGAQRPRRLPDVVAELDPDLASDIPVAADILVAGCGTGRQAAIAARQYPDARILAIDVSEASLEYARRQCAELGLANLTFEKLDLLRVGELRARFHAVLCVGVLHCLACPEAGWAALADVLQPGGVMQLAFYSLIGRLGVAGARLRLADLVGVPVDDDVIRRARRRMLEAEGDPSAAWMTRSADFATLEGASDLLLHPHEDPFTVPRIGRALEATGMRLLRFLDAPPPVERAYDAMFPDDPRRRDLAHWAAFEKRHPRVFAGMYRFWCGKPA